MCTVVLRGQNKVWEINKSATRMTGCRQEHVGSIYKTKDNQTFQEFNHSHRKLISLSMYQSFGCIEKRISYREVLLDRPKKQQEESKVMAKRIKLTGK